MKEYPAKTFYERMRYSHASVGEFVIMSIKFTLKNFHEKAIYTGLL